MRAKVSPSRKTSFMRTVMAFRTRPPCHPVRVIHRLETAQVNECHRQREVAPLTGEHGLAQKLIALASGLL